MIDIQHFLKKSVILEKLKQNKTASCIKLNVASQASFEIAAMSGVDAIWICREHVGSDWCDVETKSAVAKLYGCDLIVRVERGSYSDLIKPLELDAAGIMVPHVRSAAEAAEIVRQTRFYPMGLRAWDGGNADGKYGQLDAKSYMDYSNYQKLIILQIEDAEAVDNIDEICAVDGFNMVFFGPGDLSQAYGIPGEINHPKIAKARIAVAQAAKKHGKLLGTVTTAELLPLVLREGYQLVNIGSDVHVLANAYKGLLNWYETELSLKGV